MEISGTEAIKRLVAAGVGLTFISRQAVSLEVSLGILRLVNNNEFQIPMRYYVISAKDQHYYPTVLAFLNFIRKQAGS